MGRRPEIFVRELDPDDAQKLVRICRTAKNRVRLRRAGIVLASVQGRSASEIAELWAAKDQTVREVIKAFNEHGFAALDPKEPRASRPVNKTSDHVAEQVCRTAKIPPQRLGLPFTQWSLSKLVDYLREQVRITASRETVRQLLRHAGISWHRIRDRKRWREFLDFLKQLRRRYPHGKLYLVVDNYGPHTKADVRHWCTEHDIELVFTPTHASWLNWVEAEFTSLRYFVLDGSDYPSHAAQETAIAGYIRWRNKRAQPKRHFAIGSKIRQPDYLPYAA